MKKNGLKFENSLNDFLQVVWENGSQVKGIIFNKKFKPFIDSFSHPMSKKKSAYPSDYQTLEIIYE